MRDVLRDQNTLQKYHSEIFEFRNENHVKEIWREMDAPAKKIAKKQQAMEKNAIFSKRLENRAKAKFAAK